jgi:hypothetical protein
MYSSIWRKRITSYHLLLTEITVQLSEERDKNLKFTSVIEKAFVQGPSCVF